MTGDNTLVFNRQLWPAAGSSMVTTPNCCLIVQDPCCLGDPGLTAREHSGSAPGERVEENEGQPPVPAGPH